MHVAMIEHPAMQFEETLRAVQMRGRAGSNPRISDVVYDSRNVTVALRMETALSKMRCNKAQWRW